MVTSAALFPLTYEDYPITFMIDDVTNVSQSARYTVLYVHLQSLEMVSFSWLGLAALNQCLDIFPQMNYDPQTRPCDGPQVPVSFLTHRLGHVMSHAQVSFLTHRLGHVMAPPSSGQFPNPQTQPCDEPCSG
jgi:hypothetical protein